MIRRAAEPDTSRAEPAPSNPWLLARDALELASSFGCVPSPKAYEVFFGYASGHAGVRAAVDRAAHPEHLLTSFDLDRIHHEHFRTNDGEWERQQKASHQIEAKLGVTAGALESHMELGEAYERELTRASGAITKTRSAEDLSVLVKNLLSETGTVRDATAAMRQSLVSTQKEVGSITRDLASSRKSGAKDLLTGLIGRSGFDVQLETVINDSLRNGMQMVVTVISIDKFDALNAEYGRLTGDVIIRTIGRKIGRFANGNDLVSRIGGVKFAMVVQGCSTRESFVTAEAIRSEIESRTYQSQEDGADVGGVSVSVGMSLLEPRDTAASLLERAEQLVATARDRGGNTVQYGNIQII